MTCDEYGVLLKALISLVGSGEMTRDLISLSRDFVVKIESDFLAKYIQQDNLSSDLLQI